MKNIDQNSLEELNALINRIAGEIEKYKHVSEYLPKTLINAINNFDMKIINELESREEM
jgi:hypothetical protein